MSRRALTLLTLIAALTVLIAPLGRDLFVGDETKYGQVVREMRAGEWLVPHLNGEPYTHKPPLHFWIITALTVVLGNTTIIPFVLQSLVAFAATILFVRFLGRQLFSERAGVIAGFVWATFLLAWGTAQTARMDSAYILLLTLAIWLVWRYLELRGSGWLLAGAGAAIGVSILIKGPMSLIMLLVLLLLERIRRGPLRGGWAWLGGLLLTAAIALAWLVPGLIAGGAAYADELLIRQNVGRAVGSWVHREPFWFYIPRFPATFFPSFAAVLFAIVAIWKRPLETEDRQRRRFLVSWMLAVLIPFSLLSGKLDIYMLPALVPAALLCGAFLEDVCTDALSRWTVRLNRVVLGFLLLLGIAVPLVAPSALEGKAEAVFASDPRVIGLFVTMAIASAMALAASFSTRFRTALGTTVLLAGATIVTLVWIAGPAMPLINEESSGVRLVRALESTRARGEQMALHRSPHLWTRSMRDDLAHARHVDPHELAEMTPSEYPEVLVTRRDREEEVQSILGGYEKVESVTMIGKEFDVWRRR